MADLIDGFEDGDIAEYEGATTQFAATTAEVKEGSYALEGTNDGTTSSIGSPRGGDLPTYLSPGDDFEYYVYHGSSNAITRLYFEYVGGTAGAAPSGWNININVPDSTISLNDGNTTLAAWNQTIPANEWLRVLVESTTNGDLTINLYDSSGTELFSGSPADETWTDEGGIAWMVRDSSGTTTSYFDHLVLDPYPPAAPQNVSATVEGDDQIELTWDEDTSGGDADEYDVQVSEDGGAWSQVATTTATSYTYSATPSVNDHKFRVRAVNVAGTSDWTESATKTTDPTNLSVTGHDASSIDLSWTGTDDESNYRVLRAESSGGSYAEVGTPTGTTFSDTGLENGEQYFYVVEAEYPGTNSQQTNEVSQITDLPEPTLDSLDAGVEDEITVNWTLNDNSSDGSVEVYRSTDGSLGSAVHTETNLGTTSYTDTGLDDGEQYHYTIRRVTDHVEGDSGQQSAITVLPAPTTLSVDAIAKDSADISWTDNHDYGDTRVEFKQSDAGSWTTFSTLSRNTEVETLTGLLNGEQYDVRVVATTEHTSTEDQ